MPTRPGDENSNYLQQLYNLLYDPEEVNHLSNEEIEEELKVRNIDCTKHKETIKQYARQMRGEYALLKAKAKREFLDKAIEQMKEKLISGISITKADFLKDISSRNVLSPPLLTAYHRKLDHLNEHDFESLVQDGKLLDLLEEVFETE